MYFVTGLVYCVSSQLLPCVLFLGKPRMCRQGSVMCYISGHRDTKRMALMQPPASYFQGLFFGVGFVVLTKLKKSSCEMEHFVETHLCKLCVILRSRVLRVSYGMYCCKPLSCIAVHIVRYYICSVCTTGVCCDVQK